MRIPKLRELAALASLVTRAMRTGAPPPVATPERLANIPTTGLPLAAPVTIHWDQHQIPSIVAGGEDDLAVALGVVHAHLRLAQLEAMRRLAHGRVSEVVGPAGLEIDHALRLMRFDAAVPAMEAALPEPTRRWLEGFVAGINHHIAHAPALPHEFALLDFRPEPWTLTQLLTVTRLASTDASWLVFGRLLKSQAVLPADEWAALWPEMQAGDALPWPASQAEAPFGFVRGSNSAAIPAARSQTGMGLIASDPHLSITLPPLWLVVGLHAPGLDVVGLMIPGVPAVGLGRNRWLAWGGTNLHAASSDLVDVAQEPVTERREQVPVRGRAPATIVLRETRFGPVVSDGMLLRADRPLALQWVGHRASDEMTALLGAMRAQTWEAFRAALGSFAIPGQTMVAVEAGPDGRAGRVIAAHLPRRENVPMPGLVHAPGAMWALDDLVMGTDFFSVGDQPVVSANDRPSDTTVPVGFFFAPPERMERLRSLLRHERVTPAEMRALPLDLLHPRALAMRDALLARMAPDGSEVRRVLAAWDGRYDAGSEGALVFEVMVAALARRLIRRRTREALSVIWTGRLLIAGRLVEAPPAAMRAAVAKAARARRRYRCWGGAHQISLRHPLAALPGVGRAYARPPYPADGGNDTLNKTGHGPVTGWHNVGFGACARHMSDLSDPNANDFVLLGGQDGWLGSANATDQVALWRAGQSIRVPLRAEATASWPYRTVLQPK